MPLYEYHCEKCDTTFEVIQKFSDATLTEHEGCGGHVERLLSAPGFHFKGSGWYVTDYARAGAKSEAKSESKTESKSEVKTESKPETKSETKPAPAAKTD